MTDETGTQDLGIQKPAMPDRNWSRTQPMNIPPSEDQLNRKHQLVSIKNTSDVTVGAQGRPVPQMHIVIDRFNAGHEIGPGETKHDVDMIVDDIEYFVRERKPGRVNNMGQLKPRHPIEIIGYDEGHLRETARPQTVKPVKET